MPKIRTFGKICKRFELSKVSELSGLQLFLTKLLSKSNKKIFDPCDSAKALDILPDIPIAEDRRQK